MAALAAISRTVARRAEAGNVLRKASASSCLFRGSRFPIRASNAVRSRGSSIWSNTVYRDAWFRNRAVSASCAQAAPHCKAPTAARTEIQTAWRKGLRTANGAVAQDGLILRLRFGAAFRQHSTGLGRIGLAKRPGRLGGNDARDEDTPSARAPLGLTVQARQAMLVPRSRDSRFRFARRSFGERPGVGSASAGFTKRSRCRLTVLSSHLHWSWFNRTEQRRKPSPRRSTVRSETARDP